jgi:hypothetical protein
MWKLGYSIFLHGEIFHFHLEGTESLGQVGGGLLSPNLVCGNLAFMQQILFLLWQDFFIYKMPFISILRRKTQKLPYLDTRFREVA